MEENILPKAPPTPFMPAPQKKKAKRVSGIAIFIVALLTIVLIILGERFFIDLNTWFNPANNYKHQTIYYDEYYPNTSTHTTVYDKGDYEIYRLLVHTAFVIPLLLGGFLLYFWMYYHHKDDHKKIIAWPYFIFSLWMTIHLIGEALYFFIDKYEKLGIYIVLIILATVLTFLAIYAQRKWQEKHLIEQPHE